jgi:putative hydrolase of the HAD superfamily
MFKAVVFDLYETLITQTGTPVPRAGALGESLGLDATAYRREWKQLRPRVLCGQLTFQQALLEVGTRLGVAILQERVQRACDERIRANTEVFQKIDLELLALTRDLHARGVRLATISNCMAEDVVA